MCGRGVWTWLRTGLRGCGASIMIAQAGPLQVPFASVFASISCLRAFITVVVFARVVFVSFAFVTPSSPLPSSFFSSPVPVPVLAPVPVPVSFLTCSFVRAYIPHLRPYSYSCCSISIPIPIPVLILVHIRAALASPIPIPHPYSVHAVISHPTPTTRTKHYIRTCS